MRKLSCLNFLSGTLYFSLSSLLQQRRLPSDFIRHDVWTQCCYSSFFSTVIDLAPDFNVLSASISVVLDTLVGKNSLGLSSCCQSNTFIHQRCPDSAGWLHLTNLNFSLFFFTRTATQLTVCRIKYKPREVMGYGTNLSRDISLTFENY